MGKRKVTELKDVRVSHVSFVEEGANGERFEIFKSVDGQPQPQESTEIQLDTEKVSIVEKFLQLFTRKNTNKGDTLDMEATDKILKSIDTLKGDMANLSKKVDTIVAKDGKGDAGETQIDDTNQPAAKTDGSEGQSKSTDTPADAKKTAAPADSEGGLTLSKEVVDQLVNGVEDVKKGFDELKQRVDTLEGVRNTSNASPEEATQPVKNEKDMTDDEVFEKSPFSIAM